MIRSSFMCFRVCAAVATKDSCSEEGKWAFEVGVSCKCFSCKMYGNGRRLALLVAFSSHLLMITLVRNAP